MGKITTSPRYVIDITEMDLLSFGDFGGGFFFEKLEKNEGIFNLRKVDEIGEMVMILGGKNKHKS